MLIRNGALALPGAADFAARDLRVLDGKIAAIGERLRAEPGEDSLDARGRLVFPGAIDPHVHFDEPGFERREDFEHGSAEAARGGVTTVIDMPCTSLPPVTTPEALRLKLDAIGRKSYVDFALYGGVEGNSVERSLEGAMAELAPDVVGFKCYFCSGMDTFARVTHYDFPRILAKAAGLGRPLLLHAEDHDYIAAATAALKAARPDAGDWNDYVTSRPAAAETVACQAAIALASFNAPNLHVVHVGTAEAAIALAEAGATCETCAHYLEFSSDDFAAKGSALKTAPVVKGPGEAAKLWTLLARGAISFCASDHAPAAEAEKRTGSAWTDYGGIPGTGTMFPYLLSEGLFARRLPLDRFLEVVSENAAKRWGLAGGKGSLEPGKDADFVLVDPDDFAVMKGTSLYSKGKLTPFEGMRLRGRVVSTWVRGMKVYDADRGIVAERGHGRLLRWGYR